MQMAYGVPATQKPAQHVETALRALYVWQACSQNALERPAIAGAAACEG